MMFLPRVHKRQEGNVPGDFYSVALGSFFEQFIATEGDGLEKLSLEEDNVGDFPELCLGPISGSAVKSAASEVHSGLGMETCVEIFSSPIAVS